MSGMSSPPPRPTPFFCCCFLFSTSRFNFAFLCVSVAIGGGEGAAAYPAYPKKHTRATLGNCVLVPSHTQTRTRTHTDWGCVLKPATAS